MQIFRQILHVQEEAWKIILPNSASKLTQNTETAVFINQVRRC